MHKQEIRIFNLKIGSEDPILSPLPCSLYKSLLSAGKIADPFVGTRIRDLAPYEEKDCEFAADVDLDASMLSHRFVYLRIFGIDTHAEISWNGKFLAEADNVHRTYMLDLSGIATEGGNRLSVYMFSPSSDEKRSENENRRPPEFSLGNDSFPRLPDRGIYGKVEILSFDNAILENIHYSVRRERDVQVAEIGYSLFGDGTDVHAVACLRSSTGRTYFAGLSENGGEIRVPDAEMWMPHSLGVPNCYTLSVNLYVGETVVDSMTVPFGFRKLAFTDGAEPQLLINDRRFYAHGAEILPTDLLLSRSGCLSQTDLIDIAAAGRIDLLRFSSGIYADEAAACACDRAGIALVQDIFILPEGRTPTVAYRQTLEAELLQNAARLACHPATCLFILHGDEGTLMDSVTSALKAAAPHIPVFVSHGDDLPFTRLSGASFPELPTVEKMFGGAIGNPLCGEMEYHNTVRGGNTVLLSESHDAFPYAFSAEELFYSTRVSQAKLIASGVRHARIEDKKCGVIVDRLNDPWPSVSPSLIDYYGRRKPAYFRLAKMYAPVVLDCRRDGTSVTFSLKNDLPDNYHGKLYLAIYDAGNDLVFETERLVEAPACAAKTLFTIPFDDRIKDHETDRYLYFRLYDGTNTRTTGTVLFTSPKHFAFRDPEFSVKIEGSGREFSLLIAAKAFVKDVTFDFAKTIAYFAENDFDITRPTTRRVRFTTAEESSAGILTDELCIHSVYGIGKEP